VFVIVMYALILKTKTQQSHVFRYHTGRRWTRAGFPLVVGVVHTNYYRYILDVAGEPAASTIRLLNRFLCRQHCHKVIKLSDAVQPLPRQETCFVHGVAAAFLDVGAQVGEALRKRSKDREGVEGGAVDAKAASEAAPMMAASPEAAAATTATAAAAALSPTIIAAAPSGSDIAFQGFTKDAYFLGKAVWPKGFRELVDRAAELKARFETSSMPPPIIDCYGRGDDLNAIVAESTARGLPLDFLGAMDHRDPTIYRYRAFVNPSTSDVVATTSAEALAMGKWLVVPRHPCNEWLSTFPNCLVYDDGEPGSFCTQLEKALGEDPAPLSAEAAARLSWEHATDRFMHCCANIEYDRGGLLARAAGKTMWGGER
jgi:digalactosyldiacylglycerol synthase